MPTARTALLVAPTPLQTWQLKQTPRRNSTLLLLPTLLLPQMLQPKQLHLPTLLFEQMLFQLLPPPTPQAALHHLLHLLLLWQQPFQTPREPFIPNACASPSILHLPATAAVTAAAACDTSCWMLPYTHRCFFAEPYFFLYALHTACWSRKPTLHTCAVFAQLFYVATNNNVF